MKNSLFVPDCILLVVGCKLFCLIPLALSSFHFSSQAHAGVTLEQIGDPVFTPSLVTFSQPVTWHSNASSWWQQIDSINQRILGDTHIVNPDGPEGVLLPGKSHANPADRLVRELVAAYGLVNTDTFLADDIRGNRAYNSYLVLVPNENANTGLSPSSAATPVIPNDIFPLRIRTEGVLLNGDQLHGPWSDRVPSLGSIGQITDNQRIEHDFTNLNWDHIVLPGSMGNGPSTSREQISGEYESRFSLTDINGDGWRVIERFDVVPEPTGVLGDLNYDKKLDLMDLDILTKTVSVAPGQVTSDALRRGLGRLDINADESVNVADIHHWVTQLKSTRIGDADLDGEVEFDDFLVLSDNFGHSGGWGQGDFDGNGEIDFSDFLALSANFGLAGSTSAAAVPEPTGVCLALFRYPRLDWISQTTLICRRAGDGTNPSSAPSYGGSAHSAVITLGSLPLAFQPTVESTDVTSTWRNRRQLTTKRARWIRECVVTNTPQLIVRTKPV